MLINPNGSKYWQYKYIFAGKNKVGSFGVYPEVSLKAARLKRDEYRRLLNENKDPTLLKKQQKLQLQEDINDKFENIAMEWFKRQWPEDELTREAKNTLSRLKRHVFQNIGCIPIKQVSAQQIISMIQAIENRGTLEEAKRTKQIVGRIFKYAVATKRVEHNLVADLDGAFKPSPVRHYPHFTEKEFIKFLNNFDEFKGYPITKLALKFMMVTFVRSCELRQSCWEEIDFEKKEWRVPDKHAKMKRLHIVPLSDFAIKILNEVKLYLHSDGTHGLIFPSISDPNKPMSDNTLSKAFRDQGYKGKITPHGLRGTASTILNENGFKPDVIERQLSHCERNKVRACYNHAEYLQDRRKMMEWWGNFVESQESK